MRITLLSPSLSREAGGIFEVERRHAQALDRLDDVDVRVVGLEDDRTATDKFEWAPLEPEICSTMGPDAFGYAPDLLDTLLSTDADILHLHGLWMYTSIAARRWSRVTEQPYVVSPHGMLDPWALNHAGWKKRLAGWLYENASLRSAACLHALNGTEREAIRAYGLSGPVCTVPNGVDLPDRENAEIAPAWNDNIADDEQVLLFLGRIHPKKGLQELLEGWADAEKTVNTNSWRLVVVGWDDGGHLQRLRERVQSLGLTSEVLFLGPLYGDEKDAAFRNADAFILPSFSEGLPMTVLEAWSYRLPVLMTAECNLTEGFEAGAAYEIDPNPTSIAEGLTSCLGADPSDRRRMGECGRKLVEEQYTWPLIARSLHSVYQWLLEQGPRPSCVDTV